METDYLKESVHDFAYPIYFNQFFLVSKLIFFIFEYGFSLYALLNLINLKINEIQMIIKLQRSNNSNIIIN